VAFFSAVDIDHVLRKEVNDDCRTPSFPEGIRENGKSLTMEDIIEKLGDRLRLPDGTEPRLPLYKIPDGSLPEDSKAAEMINEDGKELWLRIQMAQSRQEIFDLISRSGSSRIVPKVERFTSKTLNDEFVEYK
jgi:DNA polymerase gamma 1